MTLALGGELDPGLIRFSESTAVWLSLGGTAASWTLLAVASKMDGAAAMRGASARSAR